jgi:hypothetical protein
VPLNTSYPLKYTTHSKPPLKKKKDPKVENMKKETKKEKARM